MNPAPPVTRAALSVTSAGPSASLSGAHARRRQSKLPPLDAARLAGGDYRRLHFGARIQRKYDEVRVLAPHELFELGRAPEDRDAGDASMALADIVIEEADDTYALAVRGP